MQDFTGKTAFITGGASGVGLGMAKAFAKAGANVVIGDIQTDRLTDAASQLAHITDAVLAIEVDTTDIGGLEQAAQQIERTFSPVSILCNNAGIGGGGEVLATPDERW